MYTVYLESKSGNEHEMMFDAVVNYYWDEPHPGAREIKVYDGMIFHAGYILVNKKKRKINVNLITSIDRKNIETAILSRMERD